MYREMLSSPHIHYKLPRLPSVSVFGERSKRPKCVDLVPCTVLSLRALTGLDTESLYLAHEDFTQFVSVVQEDIHTKTDQWVMVKYSVDSYSNNIRTYAAIQIFMLRRYNRRIHSFRETVLESVRNICDAYWKEEKEGDKCEGRGEEGVRGGRVGKLVKQHLHILVKMKRRLKHMMDVTDKYLLSSMVDTLGSPTILHCTHLDPSLQGKFLQSRSLSVSQSIDSSSSSESLDYSVSPQLYLSYSSPSISCSRSTSCSPNSTVSSKLDLTNRKLMTLRSVSDHLGVLTRTYTQSGE